MFADLHLHTSFSDSSNSPLELALAAKKAGLSCIAVVDHDTVSGIKPAIEAGIKNGIEVLPGIELTAQYEDQEIHILGYLIDYNDEHLIKRTDLFREVRSQRIYKITDKLKSMGLNLDPQSVFDIANNGTASRLHVARAMVKEKLVGSLEVAFRKYIGDKQPACVLGFRLSPLEAIKLIKEVKGIPVLAHPYTIADDDVLIKVIECGMMGIEAYYPEHSQSMVNFYRGLAEKYNLLLTGGSDCHGTAKPQVRIGAIKIPYQLVEKLKLKKQETYG